MSEPSPRPWRVEGDQIVDANGFAVTPIDGGARVSAADAALIVDAVNERDRLCGIVLALCDEVEAMDDSDAVVLTDRAARIQNLIAEAREILGAGETPKGKGVGV